MSVHTQNAKKVTVNTFGKLKLEKEKISVVTCYDFTTAKILDNTNIDALLVGDSAANIMAGYSTTLPISIDEMIIYARSVVKGANRPMVIVDMPFGSYQSSPEQALDNAVRIVKETGCQALKLEGGEEILPQIQKILQAGIPVMGHLGLTPQSINKFGGYGLRANNENEANKLIKDAHLLEEVGCFSIVLEKIPMKLAGQLTQELTIPTIGIGAGPNTDGQVLVFHDMMGLNDGFKPKFLRTYANLSEQIVDSINHYVDDVKNVNYPNESESF